MRRSLLMLSFGILLVTLLFGNGCKVSTITRDDIVKNDFPVAVIDDSVKVMASDLYLRMANSDLLTDGGVLDSTTYFDTLKNIVIDSVISIEAESIDLRKDVALYNVYENRYLDFYIRYLYNFFVLDSIAFDSMEVVNYAKSFPDRYTFREQVHARQITVSSEGLAKGADSMMYKDMTDAELDSAAKALIFDIKAQVDTGADFGYLANLYSSHRESGDKDGDLGFFTRSKYFKEFTDTAFSLEEGAVSEPFLASDGWHIIEVINHVDSGLAIEIPEVFRTAAQDYMNSLAFTRSAHLVDSLESAAEYKFNDTLLFQNPYDVDDTVWAVIVNDIDTVNFYRMADYMHQYKNATNIEKFTANDIHEFLKNRCRKFLLARLGDKNGFDQVETVKNEREKLYHQYAVDMFLKGRQPEPYEPTDSMIEEYYTLHADRYIVKKPLKVQHIIAEDSLFAEYLRDQALSGVDFLELAQEHYPGAEEIRVAAADLGYIGPGELPDQFYHAALGTAVGGVSHPVKTDFGYHIIKVLDKNFSQTLEEVGNHIKGTLVKEHDDKYKREWNENLLGRHKIEYRLEKLKRLELDSKKRR